MNTKHISIDDISLLNWGPFDGLHSNLDTSVSHIGINGENGAGKTSLIDAVLSTMVSERKLPLGGASSSSGAKKERSFKSYANGMLPGTVDGEVEYLRSPGDLSICLINVSNEDKSLEVCFGFFIQINKTRDISKSFFIREAYCSLGEDSVFNFNSGLTPKELKQNLKENGFNFYDKFKLYQSDLYRKLNLNDKKIDLLLKTVSMKEIKEIDQFIKDTIVDSFNFKDLIDDLVSNTEKLTSVDKKIQLANQKLNLLIESEISQDEYNLVNERIKQLIEIQNNIEALRKHKLIPVYESEISKSSEEIEILNAQIETLEENAEQLDIEIDELTLSINSSDKARDMLEKEKELKGLEDKLLVVEKTYESFDAVLNKLGITSDIESDEDFIRTKKKLSSRITNNNESIGRLGNERIKLLESKSLNEKKRDSLSAKIKQIEDCSVLVDEQFIEKRDLIERNFAGDIKCRHLFEFIALEEGEWDLAFEKKLRPFQDVYVVECKFENDIISFLEKNEISARLIFVSSDNISVHLGFKGADNFNMRQDTPVEVFDFLNSVFGHDDLSKTLKTFKPRSLNIDLGEKDSVLTTIDFSLKRSDYNAFYLTDLEKTKRKVEKEMEACLSDLETIAASIHSIESNIERLNEQNTIIYKIDNIQAFKDIDVSFIERKIADIEDELDLLRGKSDYLMDLKAKRDDLKSEQKTLYSDIGGKREAVKQFDKKILEHELIIQNNCALLSGLSEEDFTRVESDICEVFNVKFCSSSDIEGVESYFDDIKGKQDKRLRQEEKNRSSIERKSGEVALQLITIDSIEKEKFSDFMSDSERIECLDIYKTELQSKELPDLQKKFREYLEDDLAQGLSQLQANIHEGVDSCFDQAEEFNEFVNKALPEEKFSKVELKVEEVTTEETRRFNHELESLIPDFMDDSYDEEYAKKLSVFMNQLKDERYVNRCANPAERVKFCVIKNGRDYSSSKSFSGGERIELCYFILAASYLRVFELMSNVPTLRLMIVDEISMKLDSDNIRKSLEIFTSLDVQLFAIEPEANFDILSDCVEKVMFIKKKEDGKTSLISLAEKENIHKSYYSPTDVKDILEADEGEQPQL